MGLFKKLFKRQKADPASLSQAEALAAIAVAAIAADGRLLDEERQSLFTIMSGLQIFKKYSQKQRMKLLEKLFELLRQKGGHNLVDSAKDALPPNLRETAFAVATKMILADGIVTESERNFLRQLQETLEIPKETASQMLKSLVIKPQK